MSNDKEQFKELLSKFHVGMLTTVSKSSGLHSRPIGLAEVEDDGRLFLLTDRESENLFST